MDDLMFIPYGEGTLSIGGLAPSLVYP